LTCGVGLKKMSVRGEYLLTGGKRVEDPSDYTKTRRHKGILYRGCQKNLEGDQTMDVKALNQRHRKQEGWGAPRAG